MPIEIEKKYRLTKDQRALILRRLRKLGATRHSEEFEENTLYAGQGIDGGRAVLRLRRVGDRAILTFKKRFPSTSAIKRQLEEETEVSDADAIESILKALGYRVSLVYEKRRLTWTLDETEIVVDELPFGLFMEIEGLENDIEQVERKLNAESLAAVEETYPALTRQYGKPNGEVVEARFPKTSVRSIRRASGSGKRD
jgi:adenylate cyclase, class 2